jgi:hypothetical protein
MSKGSGGFSYYVIASNTPTMQADVPESLYAIIAQAEAYIITHHFTIDFYMIVW